MATLRERMKALREKSSSTTSSKRYQSEGPSLAERMGTVIKNTIGIDKNFSQQGVRDFGFRAGLSQMDTPEEAEAYLNKRVGPGLWTQDQFGNYALTPQGAMKFGIQTDRPIVIDEKMLTLSDVADVAGDSPAMMGAVMGAIPGTAYGTAAAGPIGGVVGGATGALLGAMGGKGLGETYEYAKGRNKQSFGEVASDVLSSGLDAARGELLFGPLGWAGRKFLSPSGHRMTPERRDVTREALEVGVTPRPTAVAGAPILGRLQSMAEAVGGSPKAIENAAALRKELDRLMTSSGPPVKGKVSVGEGIRANIKKAKNVLNRWGQIHYGPYQGVQLSTQKLKDMAKELIPDFPVSAKTGQPILANQKTVNTLEQILELPDTIPLNQLQSLRAELWDAVDDKTLFPDLTTRQLKRLYGATTDIFRASEDVAPGLKAVNDAYAGHIDKFKSNIISRITSDKQFANSLSPEQIVPTVFAKNNSANVNRVMFLLNPKMKEQVRRVAMEDVLDAALRRDPKSPLKSEMQWNGKGLLDKLDSYGEETLEAMFGKDLTEELYRFGRVIQSAQWKVSAASGGIVVANVALHPVVNLPTILKLNVVSRYFMTPTGLRHFTDGLEAPKTRAGAAALTRTAIQLGMMADEITSGPPPSPQQDRGAFQQARGTLRNN